MLREILNAREERWNKKLSLAAKFKLPVLSFMLNIPGSNKTKPLHLKAHRYMQNELLEQIDISPVYQSVFVSADGPCALFVLDADYSQLKQLAIKFEETPYGRLCDVDIMTAQGIPVGRDDIGLPMRKCYVCDGIAKECIAGKKHSMEEICICFEEKLKQYIDEYISNNFPLFIEKICHKALLLEVQCTPKPGLVDLKDNGSHKNMDYNTFINSSDAISPYFGVMSKAAIQAKNTSIDKIFGTVRNIGIDAEKYMLSATGGVNTHKGAIFSMGILISAISWFYANKYTLPTLDDIVKVSSDMVGNEILKDLKYINLNNASSHGEVLYAKYSVTGIRGEAATGFSTLINNIYPYFISLLERGFNLNDAGAILILKLITEITDTNIISRSNMETYISIKYKIQTILDKNILDKDYIFILEKLNRYFIELNISPGGSADMLANTYMLYLFYKYFEEWDKKEDISL